MNTYRPTWAEIDLNAIRHNYRTIKNKISKDVMIMAIVKANAYGHGSVEVAKVFEDEKVSYLGVATLDEALALRDGGIKSSILILGAGFSTEVEAAYRNNITLTLCNDELLNAIIQSGYKVKVHIKVDTGMGRIGVWHENALDFIRKVKAYPNIEVEGIFTHFSIAGRDKDYTSYQINSFNNVINDLVKEKIDIPIKHAANSIATIDWPDPNMNMVRPGLILYGMYPKRDFPKKIQLRPTLALKTKIVFIKDVEAGRSIGYGRTYIAAENTRIATLPIGYADGYGRILSGKAEVIIKGHKYPVIGKVTMDQTMVDIGNNKGIKVEDEVVLIGRQFLSEVKIGDLARQAGTIPYEIVTGITARVPRKYIS
ncbi:MAG: alanine racemase [Candidatus Omnitrophica bacterium]|nr:alanine racemase [Candidatus Omnitrophota bacterium]